jgi:GntR family transcriptional repressor for pyruvate dehydrogenase complex
MVTPSAQPPADRNRLYVSVVSDIEAQILSGALRVGDRLPAEAEIARRFAISTRSVREALQILETKGLVRRRHGERAEVVRDDVGQYLDSLASTVSVLVARDPAYLKKLMDVRAMFELEVVGRLASGEGRLGGPIDAALAQMRASVPDNDFMTFTAGDAAFHRALVQALDNDVMSTLHGNLHGIIAEVIRVSSSIPRKSAAEGLAEHEAIYDAILARDVAASRRLMAEHIANSGSYLQSAVLAAQQAGETDPATQRDTANGL